MTRKLTLTLMLGAALTAAASEVTEVIPLSVAPSGTPAL